MISVVVTGTREVEERIQHLPDAVRVALLRKVATLSLKLQRHIVVDKLSGQVLRTVSGRLKRSIQERTYQRGSEIVSEVYSDGSAPYASIHEHGGKTPAHEIVATKAQALSFLRDGKRVFYKRVRHPGSIMPERSYMRSALDDMREEIVSELSDAFRQALEAKQ